MSALLSFGMLFLVAISILIWSKTPAGRKWLDDD
jgi:hypothetical protein